MLGDQLEPVQRRLRSVAGLTDELAKVVSELPFQQRFVRSGEALYAPGATELPCFILLNGSATRFKLRNDGSRAVVAFELPGDIVNLETLLLGYTDCGVTLAEQGVVASIDGDALRRAWKAKPGLEAALWRYAFVRAAALEEWLLNIGKRSPSGRIAHLLMEVRSRLASVTAENGAPDLLHMTDKDVADAMGLHEVIATRVLGALCSSGIVRREGDTLLIDDPEELARIGEFQPSYLHMAT